MKAWSKNKTRSVIKFTSHNNVTTLMENGKVIYSNSQSGMFTRSRAYLASWQLVTSVTHAALLHTRNHRQLVTKCSNQLSHTVTVVAPLNTFHPNTRSILPIPHRLPLLRPGLGWRHALISCPGVYPHLSCSNLPRRRYGFLRVGGFIRDKTFC